MDAVSQERIQSSRLPSPDSNAITQKANRQNSPACPAEDNATVLERKIPPKQSFEYVWRSGFAGGLAGCAAKSVVAPLDRVKILFQASNPQYSKYAGSWSGVVTTMQDIYKGDGAIGLFRGHSATLLRIFPYAAIKFVAYEQIRSILIRRPEQETPIRRLISGSLAGVTSVFFTYPLEVMRVRLAFETHKDSKSSLFSIIKRIYNERPPSASPPTGAVHILEKSATNTAVAITQRTGIVNFYRGFSATIMGMLPYAGVSFLTHDTVGDLLRHPLIMRWTAMPRPPGYPEDKRIPLRSWAELFSGGVAGLVSQTASYPLEVIRRRMQVGGAVGDGHRLRVTETVLLILRERGFRGFWVGLSIGYVKVVPMVAVSFYIYERAKTWLGI